MEKVYLLAMGDYESTTIIGAYSREELATADASNQDVHKYGRHGPYVYALELDVKDPKPVWADTGDVREN